MRFEHLRNVFTSRGEHVFTLTVSDSELSRARFDMFDHALFADCEGDDISVSDKLLALELIARRLELSAPQARGAA